MSQSRVSGQRDDASTELEHLVRFFGQSLDMFEAFRNGESFSSLCDRYRVTCETVAKRAMFIACEIDTIAQLNIDTSRHDRIQLLAHQGCGLSLEAAVQRLRADRDDRRHRQQQADARRPPAAPPSSAIRSHPQPAQPGHCCSASAPTIQQSSHTPSPSSSSTRSPSPAPPPRPAFDPDLA